MRFKCLILAAVVLLLNDIDAACPPRSNRIVIKAKATSYGSQDLIDAISATNESLTEAQKALLDQETTDLIAEVLLRTKPIVDQVPTFIKRLFVTLKAENRIPGLAVSNIYLQLLNGANRNDVTASRDQFL
jgi:hypothetical protein